MWVRGGLALDGFFALPREEFGAPTLAARRTVVISALPKVLHLLWLLTMDIAISALPKAKTLLPPSLRCGTSSKGKQNASSIRIR